MFYSSSNNFIFLNETCRCLMFGPTSVIPVNLFISVSSAHRTLLQYSRITVGYSSSPFVGWVNSVSPNYLFFETMYYAAFSSVQSLSRVRLFETPWTAAHQASLSITNSRSLLKLMSIESVMPSNHLILCCPLLLLPSVFPSIRVFSNESGGQSIASGGQSIGVSASASVLPMNIQD